MYIKAGNGLGIKDYKLRNESCFFLDLALEHINKHDLAGLLVLSWIPNIQNI